MFCENEKKKIVIIRSPRNELYHPPPSDVKGQAHVSIAPTKKKIHASHMYTCINVSIHMNAHYSDISLRGDFQHREERTKKKKFHHWNIFLGDALSYSLPLFIFHYLDRCPHTAPPLQDPRKKDRLIEKRWLLWLFFSSSLTHTHTPSLYHRPLVFKLSVNKACGSVNAFDGS